MPRPKRAAITPTGRPQIPIDWNVVDRYLEAGCTGTEIASIVGMHHDTFYDRVVLEKGVSFTAYQLEKRSKGDALIRSKQFSEAMKGDRSMLIWLGKNRLGQRDSDKEDKPVNDTKLDALIEHLRQSSPHAKPTAS